MIPITHTTAIPFTPGTVVATAVEQNTEAVRAMLNGHWFSRRGSVTDIHITPDSVRYTSPDAGGFVVSYRVSFFYACDGIELGQREQSKIRFTIQPDAQLMLEVEPEPERYDEL